MFTIVRKTQHMRKLCESVYCACLARNLTSHNVSNTTKLHAIQKPLLLNANQIRKLCSLKDDSESGIKITHSFFVECCFNSGVFFKKFANPIYKL